MKNATAQEDGIYAIIKRNSKYVLFVRVQERNNCGNFISKMVYGLYGKTSKLALLAAVS